MARMKHPSNMETLGIKPGPKVRSPDCLSLSYGLRSLEVTGCLKELSVHQEIAIRDDLSPKLQLSAFLGIDYQLQL